MRIVVVVVLAIVAVGFAGVWALGQFGGSLSAAAPIEAREPLVKEPEVVVAAADPASVAPAPTERKPAAKAAPTPSAPQVAEPAPEAATTPAPPPPTHDAAAATAPAPRSNALRPNSLDSTAPAILPPAPATPPPPAAEPTVSPQAVEQAAPEVAPPAAARSAPVTAAAAPAATAAATSMASQFKSRRLTYNRPPEKLALNKPIDISLIIDSTGQNNSAEQLKDLPGTIVERDVDLSDFVAAELKGADFDIQLQTTAPRQKLSPRIANEWRWRVTPTATGTRTLTLTVYGYETGSLDAEPLDSYRDDIVVEVQQLDQVINWAKTWQPLFAVLAAAAGAISASVAFLRFRDERKAKKAS